MMAPLSCRSPTALAVAFNVSVSGVAIATAAILQLEPPREGLPPMGRWQGSGNARPVRPLSMNEYVSVSRSRSLPDPPAVRALLAASTRGGHFIISVLLYSI